MATSAGAPRVATIAIATAMSSRAFTSLGTSSTPNALAVRCMAASAKACEGLAGLTKTATRVSVEMASLINSTRLAQISAKKKAGTGEAGHEPSGDGIPRIGHNRNGGGGLLRCQCAG